MSAKDNVDILLFAIECVKAKIADLRWRRERARRGKNQSEMNILRIKISQLDLVIDILKRNSEGRSSE